MTEAQRAEHELYPQLRGEEYKLYVEMGRLDRQLKQQQDKTDGHPPQAKPR